VQEDLREMLVAHALAQHRPASDSDLRDLISAIFLLAMDERGEESPFREMQEDLGSGTEILDSRRARADLPS
jgi:hypothetical protein